MEGDLIFYQFSRSKVERGDFGYFLSLHGPDKLPTGRRLREMMDRFVFCIEGYDSDPREIHLIPEVRRFYSAFHEAWPYWLYFCNLDVDRHCPPAPALAAHGPKSRVAATPRQFPVWSRRLLLPARPPPGSAPDPASTFPADTNGRRWAPPPGRRSPPPPRSLGNWLTYPRPHNIDEPPPPNALLV